MEKEQDLQATGSRVQVRYRNENLYIFAGEQTVELNMLDWQKDLEKETQSETLVGLGVIGKLISLCLKEGIDKEIVSSEIWVESRKQGDLADLLSLIIVKHCETFGGEDGE